MKSLSIIVPIYNVEPYLERCLRSLEDQDIPREDFEIICINDGSTDNSRDVVLLLQGEFDNIIFLEQQNQGVSVARNKGMDLAQGDYLMMVDPDDFLKPNILKERLRMIKEGNLDVAYNGHVVVNEKLEEIYRFDPFFDKYRIVTGIDFINEYFKGKKEIRIPHSSVGIFYKTSFINAHRLRYVEGIPYLEDGELMAKITCLAGRVMFLNDPVYYVYTRTGSATNSRLYYSDKARNGFLKAAHDLLQFRDQYCHTAHQKTYMNQSIIQFTIVYLISHEGLSYLKHYSALFNTLKKGPLRKLQTKGSSSFYRKLAFSYNVSIHCFYMIWFLHKAQLSMTTRLKRLLPSNN
jgi:glycosyltransferase involved in cell wall biosynthesis